MTLTATVPASYGNAHAVWWKAEWLNDSGFLETLWTYRPVQGKPANGWAPGDSVTFGAPGLVEPLEPQITGTVHWQDDQGQWRSCSVNRTDSGDPGSMVGAFGKWGLSFHDKWYFLESLRAGDGATP